MHEVPSLQALAALESYERYRSIAASAADLGVTPAAISHHLRMLESATGVKLFERAGRRLLMTPAGEFYAKEVRRALALLRRSAARNTSRQKASQKTVSISMAGGLLPVWLSGQLEAMADAHPHLSIDFGYLSHSLEQATSDLFVLFARPDDERFRLLERELFYKSSVTPTISSCMARQLAEANRNSAVKSEGLAQIRPPVTIAPEQFLSLTLIHYQDDPEAWSRWFAAYDLDEQAARAPRLLFRDPILAAVTRHKSNCAYLSNPIIGCDDLVGDKVVQPYDRYIESSAHYYLAWSPEKAGDEDVLHLKEWIKQRWHQEARERIDRLTGAGLVPQSARPFLDPISLPSTQRCEENDAFGSQV